MNSTPLKSIIVTAFFCFLWIHACGITRHGLVIGVGQYQDRTWGTVHGDKDVSLVKNMLAACGYKDIATLVNKDATKAGIIASFENLSKKCKKGDIVYIHFSGHGQQVTDVNGDEDDGWDEAWIPYDAMYAYSETYKGENHLIDDEIATWLNEIKNKVGASGKILVVVDACHSGDSDRGAADKDVYVRGASDEFIIPLSKSPKRTTKIKEKWIIVSACKNIQDNCEIKIEDGGFHGILTYAIYSKFANWGKLDNKSILSELQQYVNINRKRRKQTVTISGNHSLAHFFK